MTFLNKTGIEPLLKLRRLRKSYDGATRAVDGVDLDIHAGEIVAIIGPSGAGKSTLLRCINRLVEPSEGEVHFDGVSVTDLNPRALKRTRADIGMVFQHHNLIPRTAVRTNVLHGRLANVPLYKSLLKQYPASDVANADALLASVGLDDFGNRRASTLSGGQAQRVGICRALMQNPRLLLADEPVAALDPAASRTVLDCIKKEATQRGLTCVINLHQVEYARQYATRIIGMNNGRIVFDGVPNELTDEAIEEIYADGSGVSDASDASESSDASDVSDISYGLRDKNHGNRAAPARFLHAKTKHACPSSHSSKNDPDGESRGACPSCRGAGAVSPAVLPFLSTKKFLAITAVFLAITASFYYLAINPLHVLTGFPAFARFFRNNFWPPNIEHLFGSNHWPPTWPPSLDMFSGNFAIIGRQVANTFFFAVVGTYVSAVLAFVLGLMMSREMNRFALLRGVVRFFVSFLRNVPLLVWATVMIFVFGIGAMVGVMALVLATLGFLARSYADSMDEIAGTRLEALRSTGAGYGQVLFHGLVPSFVPAWINWTLFSFEINIRASAVLGMVGAGGLGFLIHANLDLRGFRRAMSLIFILMVMVLVTEWLVHFLRKQMTQAARGTASLRENGFLRTLRAAAVVALFAFSAWQLDLRPAVFLARLQNVGHVFSRFWAFNPSALPEILRQLLVSVAIGVCALAVGIVISLVLAFLAADNITPFKPAGYIIKGAVSIIRAVPSLVLILMVVASLGFGPLAAVVGLVFACVGYLTRAFIASIEEQERALIDAMRATGATRLQIITHGLLPSVFTAFVAWIAIRLEANIADSVSLGIVGAGGVGMLISRAVRQVNFANLTTTIVVIFVAMYIIELATQWLRRKLS
ncbi:MAG: phosphonate ABC transporter ATP-binding protein [Defluviitaleaceae bacterium]|nr:phosphonate ABC transporter ATP-binding protein [Defluviitaleaceae bacterium]